MYLLHYVLPQLPELRKALILVKLYLSVVSSVVEVTVDDAMLPAANWVLELFEDCDDLQIATK